jgi:hypothetical protein
MVPFSRVSQQLADIGSDFKFCGRAEIRELPKILFDDEDLTHVVFGRYASGFALLCATNQRVLFFDKKPMYLTLEDIRYDIISDITFNSRMLDSSITLGTVHKSITFIAYNQEMLRAMSNYVQKRVMHSRSHQGMPEFQPQPTNGLFGNYKQPDSNDVAVKSSASTRSLYRDPVVIKKRSSKFFPDLFTE